ncbi:MAG: hypothetical protein MZU97_02555 [Bacillus subtilis]|nr:hypothetical protein [Bacillus subtilis]
MSEIQVKNLKKVTPLKKSLKGTITVPSDKSISHRAAMFSSLSDGKVNVKNFSQELTAKLTLSVLQRLGLCVEYKADNEIEIISKGKFVEPDDVLDAGNSGTTIRLMSGILAGQDFLLRFNRMTALEKTHG